MKRAHAHRWLIFASAALLLAALCGCSQRDEHHARAAANIWHAAEAIDRGADPADPIRAIQAEAEAIAQSAGYRIDGIPEGEAVLPTLLAEDGATDE